MLTKPQNKPIRLAVYGTLKKGGRLHHMLGDNAELLHGSYIMGVMSIRKDAEEKEMLINPETSQEEAVYFNYPYFATVNSDEFFFTEKGTRNSRESHPLDPRSDADIHKALEALDYVPYYGEKIPIEIYYIDAINFIQIAAMEIRSGYTLRKESELFYFTMDHPDIYRLDNPHFQRITNFDVKGDNHEILRT